MSPFIINTRFVKIANDNTFQFAILKILGLTQFHYVLKMSNSSTIYDIKRNSNIPKGQTENLSRKTDKTIGNKKKEKTKDKHRTLHIKLKLDLREPYKNQVGFRCSRGVSNFCSTNNN